MFCAVRLLLCALALCSAHALDVRISAKAAVLINAKTGQVLYAKNADEPLYPASTTKVLTALYALEKRGHALEAPVTISADAVRVVSSEARRTEKHPPYRLEYGGAHIGLMPGEALALRALLYGLMLSSGNDAANAIAEHVSGSVPQFIDELNAYVRAKGCTHTTLMAPHGLYNPDHKISARDLAVLTREAMRLPLFREIVKTLRFVRPKTHKQPESHFYQHNALLKPGSKFYYPKAIGVKTGYIKESGYNIVAAAEDAQRKLIAVVMGCSSLDVRYKEVCALFDAAFKERKVQRLLYSRAYDCFRTQVPGGRRALEAQLSHDLVLTYYPSEEKKLFATVEWANFALPIRAGESVGVLRIRDGEGADVACATLFAMHGIEPTYAYRIRHGIAQVRKGVRTHAAWLLCAGGCFLLFGAQRCVKRKKLFKR